MVVSSKSAALGVVPSMKYDSSRYRGTHGKGGGDIITVISAATRHAGRAGMLWINLVTGQQAKTGILICSVVGVMRRSYRAR